jgi:glycosyltransferase involved in cell wall biosynthesis
MRLGQNPAKSIEQISQPQRLTVALVTYIPFLDGYYAQSLEVLKTCLGSLWNNTDQPFDLLVFDNASCPTVREYLNEAHREQKIQYLVLSDKNIGKSGAWNFIFGSAPGAIIVYADSDVFFYRGWLEALLHVLDLSDKVGMVTGMPLLNPEEYFSSTIAWAEAEPDARLERGQLLPWEDYWRHAGSLGNDEAKARTYYEAHDALRLTLHGEQFYLGAGHFQFAARREVLQQVLPLPSQRPMGQVRALDEAINRLGYLRLSTTRWWVQHLGNNLEGWQPLDQDEAARANSQPAARRQPAISSGIWSWKPVRAMLLRIYAKSFDLLYKS